MSDIKEELAEEKNGLNFVEQIVADDIKEGKNGGRVQTRFPPEPWTSVLQKNLEENVFCVSTIRTLSKRIRNTLMP